MPPACSEFVETPVVYSRTIGNRYRPHLGALRVQQPLTMMKSAMVVVLSYPFVGLVPHRAMV